MTPNVKIFETIFPDSSTGHQTTFCGQIWWKLAVPQWSSGLPHKTKLRLRGTCPSPQSKMGRSRPKFSERCHPLTRPRPKKSIQYRLSAYNDLPEYIDSWQHNGTTGMSSFWRNWELRFWYRAFSHLWTKCEILIRYRNEGNDINEHFIKLQWMHKSVMSTWCTQVLRPAVDLILRPSFTSLMTM